MPSTSGPAGRVQPVTQQRTTILDDVGTHLLGPWGSGRLAVVPDDSGAMARMVRPLWLVGSSGQTGAITRPGWAVSCHNVERGSGTMWGWMDLQLV